ncbi:MAG: hypothetical protein Cons2KO_33640 [Congregibacter sp.]
MPEMIEKRYLRDVLSVAESKGAIGMRLRLNVVGVFVCLSVVFVFFPYYLGVFGTREYLLFGGMLIGAMTMRLSTIYRFRYLLPHLNIQSVKGRLDELDT